jgi:hypothetical protein
MVLPMLHLKHVQVVHIIYYLYFCSFIGGEIRLPGENQVTDKPFIFLSISWRIFGINKRFNHT